MKDDTAHLRKLIVSIDDAQRLQDGLFRFTTQPYLQKLFKRLARAHHSATGEFVAWVFLAGGNAPRNGSPLGALRARGAAWKARASLDPETVCMALAQKSETHVLRRLRAATAGLRETGLRESMQAHRREIEHALMQLDSFGYVMRAWDDAHLPMPRTTHSRDSVPHVTLRPDQRGST